jgi:hypothetical protein
MSVLDDLRITLQVCRDALPRDTHPIYVARMHLIWQIVQCAVHEQEPYWANRLAQAERAVDAELARREQPAR